MGLFSFRKTAPEPPRPARLSAGRRIPIVRARYDAAQTTTENTRHWSAADGLGANAANSPTVRHTLRTRAR